MGYTRQEIYNELLSKLKNQEEIDKMTPGQRLDYVLSITPELELLDLHARYYEEGYKEGLAMTRAKLSQKKSVDAMKESGIPTSEIAELTGLTPEEIEQL